MFQPSNAKDRAEGASGQSSPDRPEVKNLLVIDPESRFLEGLRTDPAYADVVPVLASSSAQAEVVLADPSSRFRAIVVSTDIVAPTLIPMIRTICIRRVKRASSGATWVGF